LGTSCVSESRGATRRQRQSGAQERPGLKARAAPSNLCRETTTHCAGR
jgi:hypothetical protein